MMSRVRHFDSIMSMSNPEEAPICIPYRYMINIFNKSYFGSHLGCQSWMPSLALKPGSTDKRQLSLIKL